MTTIYLALPDGVAVVTRHDGRWEANLTLTGVYTQCLASDPLHREHVYCGTFDKGLWRSTDAGATWVPAEEGITHSLVMAVAVSPVDRIGEYGAVWAGTEPSAIFRSEDGGATWQERPALLDIPSRPTWTFPPRPYTHHVRWITPDPKDAGRLFVAIEAGGVMRSLDGGLTWEDRKPTGPYDAHTMAAPHNSPNTVCAACGDGFMAPGDGYAETQDGGETWQRVGEGLEQHYLWGLAVDPADPGTMLISAASGPQTAHQPHIAESYIYRRSSGGPWELCEAGLPPARGTLAWRLTSNDAEPGVFYAGSNTGIYRSPDGGLNWEKLDIAWPDGFGAQRMSDMMVV